MPGKEIKLIGKTLHADGYYIASISTSAATSEAATLTPKSRPHIKISFRFDKGLIREEEQEQAAAIAKEEIPTPGFVLVKESVEEAQTTTTAAVSSTTHHHAADLVTSLDDYTSTFQSKLDATKRKMHDSYQQLANAKKQRRIQVIDPRDLPPPPPPHPSSKGKGAVNVAAARKKMMITTNRKTRNFFDGGGRSKLVKPTSIF